MAGEDYLGGISSNDLIGFQNSIAQSDPYGLAGRSLNAWQPNVSTWSPGTTAATAFGKSFLAGLLGNYANQRAADQTNAVIGVLPQLRSDPLSVVVPDGVNADAFAALKGTAILKNYQAQAQRDQSLADMLQKVGIAGLTKKAEVIGENAGYDALGQGGQNPNSPGYKLGKDTKDLENTFYNRIIGLPQYKLLSDIDSNIKALPDIAKQDNKAADVALFSTIARIRDPNSTVREGEIKINQDTQSYLDNLYGGWRGVVNGESKLTPLAKLQIVASVLPKYNELKSSYESAKNPLLDALEAQGGKRTNIPTTDFTPFQLTPLAQDLAKQESAQLQAQGIPPATIAQQLRSKYGSYLK